MTTLTMIGDTTAVRVDTMETETTDGATSWLTADEQRAWRTHLDVSRLLMYQLERDLQPFGLTNNDYEILVNLSEAENRRMRMSDLAKSTLQSKSRLSHQITRMESAGLVRRESCDTDRRGLFAVLTEQGWDTMSQVAPRHVASVRAHFIDLVSGEDLAAYHRAMIPVVAHLREERGK
jgi:DNA-binding MarR family transcriptional regulator